MADKLETTKEKCSGEYFMPQTMPGARAMSEALQVVKPHLAHIQNIDMERQREFGRRK